MAERSRPSSVIRTRAISIVLLPAITRSTVAVASPALMISTILIENPCAMSMDSVQPSHSFGSRSRLRTTST